MEVDPNRAIEQLKTAPTTFLIWVAIFTIIGALLLVLWSHTQALELELERKAEINTTLLEFMLEQAPRRVDSEGAAAYLTALQNIQDRLKTLEEKLE